MNNKVTLTPFIADPIYCGIDLGSDNNVGWGSNFAWGNECDDDSCNQSFTDCMNNCATAHNPWWSSLGMAAGGLFSGTATGAANGGGGYVIWYTARCLEVCTLNKCTYQ